MTKKREVKPLHALGDLTFRSIGARGMTVFPGRMSLALQGQCRLVIHADGDKYAVELWGSRGLASAIAAVSENQLQNVVSALGHKGIV
jgi:hypothetical protein